jgi:hypothetical protein
MQNYLTNCHTPTCFDSIVSSSGSSSLVPCKVTQVFQMELLVIQFTIKIFQGIDFKLPEDDTIVSKHVGVIICEIIAHLLVIL